MSFRIHCDRCGKYIKDVPPKDLQRVERSALCTPCQKADQKYEKFVESLKGKYVRKLDRVIQQFQDELHKRLKQLIEEHGDGEGDDGEGT